MIENGMRYLRGYVKIQIQGYSPERFLNLCSYHHILIWGLAYEDHCYELCMSVRDFKRIRPFAKKTHTKVRVKEKYGFPFSLYNNRKRKLFFAGSPYSGNRKRCRRYRGIRRTSRIRSDHAGKRIQMRCICEQKRKDPGSDSQL